MKNFLIITNYYKDAEARLTNRIKEYIENKGGFCSVFFSNGETPGEAAPHKENIPADTWHADPGCSSFGKEQAAFDRCQSWNIRIFVRT